MGQLKSDVAPFMKEEFRAPSQAQLAAATVKWLQLQDLLCASPAGYREADWK